MRIVKYLSANNFLSPKKQMIKPGLKLNYFKLVLLLAFVLSSGFLRAQVAEQEIKAAFIERFTRFVDWPKHTERNDADSVFVITILGENNFEQSLDQLFEHILIKNRKVKLIYTSQLENIELSDLIFISGSFKNKLPLLHSRIDQYPILTISDTKGFAEKGIHFNLIQDGDYIRFEINLKALKASNLKVNSLLLSSAKIIE